MRGRIIHNISMIIVAFILLAAVSVITYMGIRTYKISVNAKHLNSAVEISANIAEVGATSTSGDNFVANVEDQIGKTERTDKGFEMVTEEGLVVDVTVEARDAGAGSLLVYEIVTTDNGEEIYRLETQKYISGEGLGENQ